MKYTEQTSRSYNSRFRALPAPSALTCSPRPFVHPSHLTQPLALSLCRLPLLSLHAPPPVPHAHCFFLCRSLLTPLLPESLPHKRPSGSCPSPSSLSSPRPPSPSISLLSDLSCNNPSLLKPLPPSSSLMPCSFFSHSPYLASSSFTPPPSLPCLYLYSPLPLLLLLSHSPARNAPSLSLLSPLLGRGRTAPAITGGDCRRIFASAAGLAILHPLLRAQVASSLPPYRLRVADPSPLKFGRRGRRGSEPARVRGLGRSGGRL